MHVVRGTLSGVVHDVEDRNAKPPARGRASAPPQPSAAFDIFQLHDARPYPVELVHRMTGVNRYRPARSPSASITWPTWRGT